MSIQSGLQNVGSAVGNNVQSAITQGKSRLESVIGTLNAGISGLWNGGFVGISEAELEGTLVPAIYQYCDRIEAQIAEFNAAANTAVAFKGDTQQAVTEFVTAAKTLLQAYVHTMRLEAFKAKQAYKQWQEGQQNVAQSTSSNAQEIRSAAQGLSLD